jgi:hypothetical protein
MGPQRACCNQWWPIVLFPKWVACSKVPTCGEKRVLVLSIPQSETPHADPCTKNPMLPEAKKLLNTNRRRATEAKSHRGPRHAAIIKTKYAFDDIGQFNRDVDKAFPAATFLVRGLIAAEVDSEGRIHLADHSRQHHGFAARRWFQPQSGLRSSQNP